MKDLRQHSLCFTPTRTCYRKYGSDNPVLVFIHGVGMNQHVWQPQVDYFCKDYGVVVYDLLGHGNSAMPSARASLVDYAAQLADLIEHLGVTEFNLVGHSVGALISVEFALQHPEKIISLVPLNIVYKRDQQQSDAVLERAKKVLAEQKISAIDVTLKRWFADATDAKSREKIEVIRSYLSEVNPDGYGQTYKMFAQSDRDFDGRLEQFRKPVLYLTGECDPNSTPAMSDQMAGDTPNGQATSIAGEAHMMAYISPEKVNPIIDRFIREHSIKG